MSLRRHLLTSFVPLLVLVLVLAACGNASTTTNSTSTTASAPTATATTASATPTTASSSGAVVQTASATVGGKTLTILTNTKGLTLYYRTSDTATSVCSGGCAQAWPPLIFSGSGTPTSATSLSGTLSIVTDANGAQIAYQGHPLYTFASDSAPGQTNGQGVAQIWFVATTDLKVAGGSGGGTTPTPTSGY